jgi:hypothetical protein
VARACSRRSASTAVLDRAGFDGLIGALDEKIAGFASKP